MGNPVVDAGTGDVTQVTSTATPVTANGNSGTITCFTSTQAALTAVTFVVTNASVSTGSTVTAHVCGYSGTVITNGTPYAFANSIGNGVFNVTIVNLHTANAFAGVLKIAYRVS